MLLIEKFGGLVVDHSVHVLIPNRAYTTLAEAAYKAHIYRFFWGNLASVFAERTS